MAEVHSRGTSVLAAGAPQQLTSQKLEENTLLQVDAKNLNTTLTRIFRLIAQIVNPLVEWAGDVSPWLGLMLQRIRVINDPNFTNLVVDAPTPGGGAYVSVNKQGDNEAAIDGRRNF